MTEIYSNVDPKKLLHYIYKYTDVVNRDTQREELIDSDQFIQCASLKMDKGVTFRPHQHVWKDGTPSVIAQESWVVIDGSVKCYFYDTNGEFLTNVILNKGDASFTLEGGHTYEILEDNTIVYEYKTGPFQGTYLDKRRFYDPVNFPQYIEDK